MAKDDSLVIYDASFILRGFSEDIFHQFAASPIDEATIKSRMEQQGSSSGFATFVWEIARRIEQKGKEGPISGFDKAGSGFAE